MRRRLTLSRHRRRPLHSGHADALVSLVISTDPRVLVNSAPTDVLSAGDNKPGLVRRPGIDEYQSEASGLLPTSAVEQGASPRT